MSTHVSEEHVASLSRVEEYVKHEAGTYLRQATFFFGLFYNPEDGGHRFLRNID
jgi:hypothetical protein